MVIRLRFYRERHNMDEAYYTGTEDIYKKIKLNDLNDLKLCWNALMHDYEGETYSAWVGERTCDDLLCGGAFDPGDIKYIEQAYNDLENRKDRKVC